MKHQAQSSVTPPQDVTLDFLDKCDVDLTKICWTQLLRQTPALVGPPRPFDPLPDDFSPENLFL